MKTLLVNSEDGHGGAARAAMRLHLSLCALDVESHLLVQKKNTDRDTVIGPRPCLGFWQEEIRPHLDALPVSLYPRRTRSPFSPATLPGSLLKNIKRLSPDVVHMHWVCNGQVRLESLSKIKQPLVWTLHDFWPFTGGCHYPEGCQGYMEQCGACPQLGSLREKDLSRWIWNRKDRYWRSLDLTIVAPSHWLADCVRESSLFGKLRVEVIPNGLDLDVYRPLDKAFCRDLFNLPQDRSLILFGSINATSDKRKGFHLLQPALNRLAEQGGAEKVELVIFGATAQKNTVSMNFPVHYMGRLNDDTSMAALYSAADVVVVPSIEDNLPNVVMEALACGTPCVAFDIGGLPDMIDHQENGFLARPFLVDDLALGLRWVLENNTCRLSLSTKARTKVLEEFGMEKVTRRYMELYEDILARKIIC